MEKYTEDKKYEITFHKSTEYNPNILEPDISIFSLEKFDEYLKNILKNPDIRFNKKSQKKLENYLGKDHIKLNDNAGFLGLVTRQFKLIQKFKKSQNKEIEKKVWENLPNKEKEKELIRLKIEMNDCASIHRFFQVVKNLDDFKDDQQKEELLNKISQITQIGKSESYLSDIFELYFYFILKSKGVDIKFLAPRKRRRTCDYIINKVVTGDCKCLTGDVNENSILQYVESVADQIKSTLGHEETTIGGAIICLTENSGDFLEPFRMINKGWKAGGKIDFKILEKFIISLYENIMKDEFENKELLKYIFIYYIPSFILEASDIQYLTPDTVETKFEISFLLITHYTSEEEIEKIKEAFKYSAKCFIKFDERK